MSSKRNVAYQDYFVRLRSMYDAQCESMQEYFSRMDQLLAREIAQERELIEDEIAAHVMEDCRIIDEESYEWEGEIYLFGPARFRRLIRRSNLVTVVTYFESSLSDIVSALLQESNARRVGTAPGLRLKDFGPNNVFDRCHTVLTKYIGITDDPGLWSRAKDFIKLRNPIVHQAGFVPVVDEKGHYVPEEKSLKNAYDKLAPKGFSLMESGEMIIDPRMLDLFLEAVRSYLFDLCSQASDHFSRPKVVKN